jgi:hypothetical protein
MGLGMTKSQTNAGDIDGPTTFVVCSSVVLNRASVSIIFCSGELLETAG